MNHRHALILAAPSSPSASDSHASPSLICPLCEKSYKGKKTFTNHLSSRHPVLVHGSISTREDPTFNPTALACGICKGREPFSNKAELLDHIADQHSCGEELYTWDFSNVIRNHLGHPKLREGFEAWMKVWFNNADVEWLTLFWTRNAATYGLLRKLQQLPYSRVTTDEVVDVFNEAFSLRSDVKYIRDLMG